MATPGSRVSGTFELLEQILLQQSTIDLVKWQIVSSGWHSTMANSKRLQQILFLSAMREQDVLARETGPHQPLAISDGSPVFTSKTQRKRQASSVYALLNPVMTTEVNVMGQPHCDFSPETMLAYAPGSWQDMFVSQRPASEVAISFRYGTTGTDMSSSRATIKDAEGVRLGTIADQIRSVVDKLEQDSPFRLPPHAHQTGDEEVLKERLHRAFISKLWFAQASCVVTEVIRDD